MTPTLSFTVRRAEPVLVKPAEPTPHELKLLSDIDDQDGNRYNGHAINFYPHHPSKSNVDPAAVIRDALAKTLVFFYPLAGRLCELADRKLAVDCTAEGALFISADADITLADFGPNPRPPFPSMDELIHEPEGSGGLINTPLVLIQVTRLKCGGFVLGLRLNHAVCDAQGTVQLLHALGDIAQGASAPQVLPVWERHVFSARDPPRVTQLHPEYEEAVAEHDRAEVAAEEADDKEELQYRSFFFGPAEIAALKGQMPQSLRTCSAESPAKGGAVPRGSSFYLRHCNEKGEEGLLVPMCLPAQAMDRFETAVKSLVAQHHI